MIEAALFAIARDNESEYLLGGLAQRGVSGLLRLSEAGLQRGEADARWQLAHRLGEGTLEDAEPLLLHFACDENEHVRRRALQSLARVRSLALDLVAKTEWERATMPWTRMNVLYALCLASSTLLESLLLGALCSDDELYAPLPRGFADKDALTFS